MTRTVDTNGKRSDHKGAQDSLATTKMFFALAELGRKKGKTSFQGILLDGVAYPRGRDVNPI